VETIARPADAVPGAFADLYQRRYAPMVRTAILLVGVPAIAEEITQDAFIQLLRRWEHVRDPAAYLRRSVVNGCYSHQRRRGVERRLPQERPSVVDPPEVDTTWPALAALTPRRRTAIVLRYYEDLSLADIAVAMRCNVGTVKSLLHHGIAQLRKEVQP
jgi:RNA polymerase sigma factor (sigma-70 family)